MLDWSVWTWSGTRDLRDPRLRKLRLVGRPPRQGSAETTRYTDSLSGGLGAMITGTGDASIPLIDPHDNNVTTLAIPAAVKRPRFGAALVGL